MDKLATSQTTEHTNPFRSISETSTAVSTENTPEMKKLAAKIFIMLGASMIGIIAGLPLMAVSTVVGLLIFLTGLVLLFVAYMTYKANREKMGLKAQSLALSAKKLSEIVSQQPLLMKYFGVPNADYVLPVPDTMYGRKLASLLPDDFDKSSLTLCQYDGLHYSKAEILKGNYNGTKGGTSGTSIMLSPREALISYFEPSALKKYIFRAIANMEANLGIDSGEHFQAILENLNNFVVVTQSGDATIYLTEDDFIDLNIVKQELVRICNAMQINYEDMGLGDYSAARSTWLATGSKALAGFAITATAFSHLNAKLNEMLFKDASIYYALNNIITHFNKTYCVGR